MRTRLFDPMILTIALTTRLAAGVASEQAELDERPAGGGEWGYRPAAGAILRVT